MLFKKTYEELVNEAINDLQYNTDITNLSIGGVARSLLEVINKQLSTYYNVLDINQSMCFLSSAKGYFLDLIGGLFNVTRNQPSGATVSSSDNVQRFYVTKGYLGDYIPALYIPGGTVVSTSDGNIQYTVTSDTSFSSGAKQVYVPIKSSNTGTSVNVGVNALIWSGISDPNVYTTNDKAIITGSDTESDDNFRYRISNTALASEKANETAIRLAALSVNGVADVVLIPYSRGIGSYDVLVIPTEGIASASLVSSVQNAIDGVQAYGMKGIAKSPTVVPVDLEVVIVFSDGTTITEQENLLEDIKVSIENYIVNIPVGGEFILNELRQQIMDVSPKIKDHTIHCYYFREQPHILGNVKIYSDEMFYPNPDSSEAIKVVGA